MLVIIRFDYLLCINSNINSKLQIMNKNVGKIDKTIRIIAAVVIGALGVYFESWWGLVALVPLATALIGFCPLYCPLGASTCKKTS
jgi:hypothetical protein